MHLPEPATAAGRAGLAALIAEPARSVVAVDVDGTLAPIVPRPEDARPAPGAIAALTTLAHRVGICALVSGRGADDVVRLTGLDPGTPIQVRGHYGLEVWVAGRLDAPAPVPAVAVARARLPELLADSPAGVHVEDKQQSLVVHTRPAADPAGALTAVTPGLRALADELGLESVPGRFVLELRPPGVDKGSAVRALAGDRQAAHAVVYVGDDLGDLPAFAAVEQLREGGVAGVTVASVDPALDDAPAELAARADLVLPGPTGVVAFLTALAAAIGEP